MFFLFFFLFSFYLALVQEDTFSIRLDKRPFGFKLNISKEDKKHTVVSSVDDNKDDSSLIEEFPDLEGSILYKVGDRVVYDMKHKDVVNLLTGLELPVTFQFVKSVEYSVCS